MALSANLAGVLGFGCAAILYGAYCVLFVISTFILFRRNTRGKGNYIVIFFNFFLFALCTTHFGLVFNHFYTALVCSNNSHFESKDAYPVL